VLAVKAEVGRKSLDFAVVPVRVRLGAPSQATPQFANSVAYRADILVRRTTIPADSAPMKICRSA
jgi:hypothetical protein